MVWLILGLMLGSLYAIANGPASLDTPLPPLDAATFQLPAFLLGTAILLALEGLKKATKRREPGQRRPSEGGELVMNLDWSIYVHSPATSWARQCWAF